MNKVVIGFFAVVGLLLFMAAVRHSRLPDPDSSKNVMKAIKTGRYRRKRPLPHERVAFQTPVLNFSGRLPKSDRSAAEVAVENR